MDSRDAHSATSLWNSVNAAAGGETVCVFTRLVGSIFNEVKQIHLLVCYQEYLILGIFMTLKTLFFHRRWKMESKVKQAPSKLLLSLCVCRFIALRERTLPNTWVFNKLDWTPNMDVLYRKGHRRLYVLRRLRSFLE